MRRFALTVTGLALSCVALAQAPVPSQVEQAARTYITRAALEAPIRFLSSDLLEGLVGIRSQLPQKCSGLQSESVSIEDAELVFVGDGIQAPEYRWDDFKGAKLIAQGDAMPSWKPGDEFEAARKRALAAVGGN